MRITNKDLGALIDAHDIFNLVYKVPLNNESMKNLKVLEMKLRIILKEQNNG